ncbi:MAG: arabinose ABC transporter permease, partial [Deltaproteobacteria bacterium]
MLSLTGLAWSLKLLWAPLVDRYGKRFYWIVPSQLVIALCMLSILSVDPVNPGISIVIILAAMCFASATQDIAVDAYTIDILDEKELGMANGFRVSAYRVALIVAGGGVVALSDFFEWEAVFVGISITMALIALVVLFWKPCHAPRIKTSESGASLSIV